MNRGLLDKNILEPDVTVTAKCPACNEVVLYGRQQCPYCGARLDWEKMWSSVRSSFAIDQAISSANTIRTFNPAAVMFLLMPPLNLLLNVSGSPIKYDVVFTILCLLSLAVAGRWFLKHGLWPMQEPEYKAAKRAMRKSLALWLAVNLLNVIFLVITHRLLKQ